MPTIELYTLGAVGSSRSLFRYQEQTDNQEQVWMLTQKLANSMSFGILTLT
eukprot:m.948767 g.948767  ORF g.948767 m.948767 type:complete len:51 (+) comp310539_c0_seq1:220-372(+)